MKCMRGASCCNRADYLWLAARDARVRGWGSDDAKSRPDDGMGLGCRTGRLYIWLNRPDLRPLNSEILKNFL